MLKIFKSCLIALGSIILLYSNVYSMSPREYIGINEDRTIERCESEQEKYNFMKSFAPNMGSAWFPNIYECVLPQFYALRKNVEYQMGTPRGTDDWDMYMRLYEKYSLEKFQTYDFVSIHLEMEAYLEEKGSTPTEEE